MNTKSRDVTLLLSVAVAAVAATGFWSLLTADLTHGFSLLAAAAVAGVVVVHRLQIHGKWLPHPIVRVTLIIATAAITILCGGFAFRAAFERDWDDAFAGLFQVAAFVVVGARLIRSWSAPTRITSP